MGHFAKLSGLVGLSALLAATTPAAAGFRHGGFFHHHGSFGHCHHGQCFGLGDGLGYDYPGMVVPAPVVAPQPYPVGYDGGSYEPTGYGVVYNIPPTPPMWRPGPHIIYVHDGGWIGHHRHHHHFCARKHGMAILHGGHMSME
jgi:hypothetical protein